MPTIDLRIGEMVQGSFEPGQLNILLAFQVNCPGCFTHALPLATALYERYRNSAVRVLGLSTAFEDFLLNTVAHTRQLIEEARLVGETARHFQAMGEKRYDLALPFPVAMDAMGAGGIGLTFSRNHFPGTPTWVIFDSEYELQAGWFGHKDEQEVTRLIDGVLSHHPGLPDDRGGCM